MAKMVDLKVKVDSDFAERLQTTLERVAAAYAEREGQEFIRVYRFHQAPAELRALSTHGGDEDWLAIVPPEYEERHYINWLQEGTPFGVSSVSRHELADGTAIYIGAHS